MNTHCLDVIQMPGVGPAVSAAEFLLVCGVIAECGHRMVVLSTTRIVARWIYDEWVGGATARGFTDGRRLRDAMRVGRSTPRGLRLAAAVISHFYADEIPVLMDRAARCNAAMVNPTPAAMQALRCSPQLRRGARPAPVGLAETSPDRSTGGNAQSQGR